MTQQDAALNWQESAKRNFKTAKDLLKVHHNDWALFLGQLTLEKLLKGYIVKLTKKNPPLIHDLLKLISLTDITLTNKQKAELSEVTQFHIQARYDDIKYELYKVATETYTRKWFSIIEEYYLWFIKLY